MGDSKLLETLDSLPKLRQFDAFPKTQPMYQRRSGQGGLLTLVLTLGLVMLLWSDVRTFLNGERKTSFTVEQDIGQEIQINLDMTVAAPCKHLSLDIRDVVGDRLHIDESQISRDGTMFFVDHEQMVHDDPHPVDVHRTVAAGRKKKVQRPEFAAHRTKKNFDPRSYAESAFGRTSPLIQEGPACRLFGSMIAKKMMGNLHVTMTGHGYWSPVYTEPHMMNSSHLIHELSFGPYFPRIVEPLENSVEVTTNHFATYEYFVSIVPTIYVDMHGRELYTNQYSVTDYVRLPAHENGENRAPGIFIKYDVEPLTMVVRERSTSWISFLVRLAGVLGGVWVCTSMAFRVLSRVGLIVRKVLKQSELDTSVTKGPEPAQDMWQAPAQANYITGWDASQSGGVHERTPHSTQASYGSVPSTYAAPTYQGGY